MNRASQIQMIDAIAGEKGKPPISWMLVGENDLSIVMSDQAIKTERFFEVGNIILEFFLNQKPLNGLPIAEKGYVDLKLVHSRFEDDVPKCKKCKSFLQTLHEAENFAVYNSLLKKKECHHFNSKNTMVQPLLPKDFGSRASDIKDRMESLVDHDYLFGAIEFIDSFGDFATEIWLYPKNFKPESPMELVVMAALLSMDSENQQIYEINLSRKVKETIKEWFPEVYLYITTQ